MPRASRAVKPAAAPPRGYQRQTVGRSPYKSIEQGAATSVLLAASPLVEGVSGTYFEDCVPAPPHQPGVRRGVAGYALDPKHAARLWQVSLSLVTKSAIDREGSSVTR